MAEPFKACSVAGCNRSALRIHEGKRGFCSMHYTRWLKHGNASKILRTPSPAKDWISLHKTHADDACLVWPFAIGSAGYGVVHRPNDGSLTTAANLMCEAAHGPRPSTKHECAHSCGKGHKGCVNPKHLRWATPDENQQERAEHGTSNRGTRQWASKLTDDDIRSIRARSATETQADLAKEYGVGPDQISRIISRKRWGWLD